MERVHNGVGYEPVKDYCLIRERNQKIQLPTHKAPLESGHNGNMPRQSQFILSLPEEYVDPWNSYLKFNVQGESSSFQGMDLNGGFLSLIEQVVLVDKFGVEIERTNQCHRLSTLIYRAMFNDSYLSQAAGNKIDPDRNTPDLWSTPSLTTGLREPANKISVMIPLPFLLGLFRSSYLLPPCALNGATLWIYWSNCYDVFTQLTNSGTPSATYEIIAPNNLPTAFDANNNISPIEPLPRYIVSDLQLVTDIYVLEHELSAVIAQMTQAEGVAIRFTSWSHDSHLENTAPINRDTKFHIPIKKSYTNALKILTQFRLKSLPTAVAAVSSVYNDSVRPHIAMVYDSFRDQVRDVEPRDWMQRNGRIFPFQPTNSIGENVYYWKQAYGKNKYYLDTFSTQLLNDWYNADGTGGKYHHSFLKSLVRSPNVLPHIATCTPAESLYPASGIRVDATQPIELFFEFPSSTSTLTQVRYQSSETAHTDDVSLPANLSRFADVWVEHYRYLICYASGNKILI